MHFELPDPHTIAIYIANRRWCNLPMSEATLLSLTNVEFAYDGHTVIHDVNVALKAGDLVAMIGPNGSGKTTLLKLMCAILSPRQGRILWRDKPIALNRRRAMARDIALVPQQLTIPYAFTVSEIVRLGRTPHIRGLFGESKTDRVAVEQALELADVNVLGERFFGELSGGEQQRVVIAMALAQLGPLDRAQSSVLLLDEPTVHLDINHQIEVLELIGKLNREFSVTVLATMHDLNLASLYFPRLILLNRGCVLSEGSAREVLSQERVQDVFHTEVLVQPHPARSEVPYIVPLPRNGGGHRREL